MTSAEDHRGNAIGSQNVEMEKATELLPLSKIAIPGDHPDAIYGVRKIVRGMPLGRKMLR